MVRTKLTEFKAIGRQYVPLLASAGVNTVDELALTNTEQLHDLLTEINAQQHVVRQTPSLLQIRAWVARARELQ